MTSSEGAACEMTQLIISSYWLYIPCQELTWLIQRVTCKTHPISASVTRKGSLPQFIWVFQELP